MTNNDKVCPDCGYHRGYHSEDCGPAGYAPAPLASGVAEAITAASSSFDENQPVYRFPNPTRALEAKRMAAMFALRNRVEPVTPIIVTGDFCSCGNLPTVVDRGPKCRQCLLERGS